ncbi:MAG: response regulator transcription factor [Tissierellia bacterium]|nr:response regulator transcription factor [Tissierellia bacterium]
MIYCVEDDQSIRDLILYALKNEGLAGKGFSSFLTFEEAMGQQVPRLILLDVMLPGKDGWEILRWLKSHSEYGHVPVLMLTAKNDEIDKIQGLDMGADDYVTKPFSVLELMARIRAVLRRTGKEAKDHIVVDDLEMDVYSREVYVDGELISLTYKEFELLHYLLMNQGRVLSREQMMSKVWGFDFEGESRTVDVHIAVLRQKIGKYARRIQTIRNIGYKWGKNEE